MKGVKRTMESYVHEKIDVLKQLHIKLTKEDKQHMYNLSSEIAVDNFARKLIMHKEY